MTPSVRRKFTILDGMILVAAIACGFAMRRAMEGAFDNVLSLDNWLGRTTREPVRAMLPFLLMLTPAVLALRLRRPRPELRRLARQPGMAASCAAIWPIAMTLAGFAWTYGTRTPPSGDPTWAVRNDGMVLDDCGAKVGIFVLAAWLSLALSGRRRPERSWIDRLGRIVGIGWILILAIDILGVL